MITRFVLKEQQHPLDHRPKRVGRRARACWVAGLRGGRAGWASGPT